MIDKEIEKERLFSREKETMTYMQAMNNMYASILNENQKIYDLAFELTNGFREITEESILKDSRIIKIFRYAIAPSISQMKFGQFIGLSSVDKFEKSIILNGPVFDSLKKNANEIANFVTKHIDKQRFIWLDNKSFSDKNVYSFAKKWTCSIASDQNVQTFYRNWRKTQQEQSALSEIKKLGYVRSGFKGVLKSVSDIRPGEFAPETRVKGRTTQKADIICRNRNSGRLILVEAKAVGVELDATKRVKECCDKANDWRSSDRLGNPLILVILAGYFNSNNIKNLSSSDIAIIWEHKLESLSIHL